MKRGEEWNLFWREHCRPRVTHSPEEPREEGYSSIRLEPAHKLTEHNRTSAHWPMWAVTKWVNHMRNNEQVKKLINKLFQDESESISCVYCTVPPHVVRLHIKSSTEARCLLLDMCCVWNSRVTIAEIFADLLNVYLPPLLKHFHIYVCVCVCVCVCGWITQPICWGISHAVSSFKGFVPFQHLCCSDSCWSAAVHKILMHHCSEDHFSKLCSFNKQLKKMMCDTDTMHCPWSGGYKELFSIL